MPGQLRAAFQKLIAETLEELQQQTINSSVSPEEGTVVSINDDGTLNVQAGASYYTSVGASTTDVQVLGKQVMVITGDGRRVAVPR